MAMSLKEANDREARLTEQAVIQLAEFLESSLDRHLTSGVRRVQYRTRERDRLRPEVAREAVSRCASRFEPQGWWLTSYLQVCDIYGYVEVIYLRLIDPKEAGWIDRLSQWWRKRKS